MKHVLSQFGYVELHGAHASIAAARGQSLNEVVTDALEKALPKMQRR